MIIIIIIKLTEFIHNDETGLSGWRYTIRWTGGSSTVAPNLWWERQEEE